MSEQTYYRRCDTCDGERLIVVGDDPDTEPYAIDCATCDGKGFVPADAVCITPEIAATAAEACGEVATNWDNDADFNDDDEGFRAEANRYRAAAAALRGEG